jgi:CRISPR/Cas system CSM-associated protein Csm3 (group 7 of RAMP superfamily)
MSRKVNHTLELAGELVAQTPLHVGGAEEGLISDMPLAVDGQGRFYLPGTSLGGAIRAHCRVPDDKDSIWGFAKRDGTGNASQVIVEDAPAQAAPLAELWHGNGIDRRWGTAAQGVKYDREVLPRGTVFNFRLTLEVLQGQDLAGQRAFLGWLTAELEAGQIAFGGAGTRGLGRVKLTGTRCRERDWSRPEGILAWIRGESEDRRALWEDERKRHVTAPADRVRIEIDWHPKGPLMSKAARDGVVVDGMPFVSRRDDGQLALTLPGAGIKGAWRGQAERIVRTVLGRDVTVEAHHEQVDVPIAADLFGRARPADRQGVKTKTGQRRKGRLGFATCYAAFALEDQAWDRLEQEEDPWRSPPDGDRPMTLAMHVAIDRWTGGAAESLLYSAVEPDCSIQWEPIVLTFDASCEPLAELALLWLTLRDFCAGRIPLGYGVNRGYGDLEVTGIRIEGLNALWDGADAVALEVKQGRIDETPVAALLTVLAAAWTRRIQTEENTR